MIDKATSIMLRGKVYRLTSIYSEYATVAADPHASVADLNEAYSKCAEEKAGLIDLINHLTIQDSTHE